MKQIPLTKGKFALVDDGDLELVQGYSWHASEYRKGKGFYAKALAKGTGKHVYMHRLICGFPEGKEVDHINHDTLDNTRSNLRVCSRKENSRNMSLARNTRSGHKGVKWDNRNNKWMVQIMVDGKNIWLGRFTEVEDAIEAYRKGAKELFGDFAAV